METAIKEFINYTEPYKKYGEKIDLKIKHTMRVKDICERIAKSLNLPKEEIKVATICGLLHDIGRFEQWKKYQTYSDKDSIDHGNLGYKILKENNYLSKYTDNREYESSILKAVKYHNKFRVPKNMTKKEKMFSDIIRDADKIDILYLYQIGVFLVDDENSKISNEVYQSLLNNKLVNKKDIKTKADRTAIRLGFIFDINCKYSFQYIKENHLLEDTIEKQIKQTTNKELKNQLKEIQIVIDNYIEEMLTC